MANTIRKVSVEQGYDPPIMPWLPLVEREGNMLVGWPLASAQKDLSPADSGLLELSVYQGPDRENPRTTEFGSH